MASPITSWEGAAAYFTFADNPGALGVIFTIAVAMTVFAIVSTIRHEQHSYKSPMPKDKLR